MRRVDFETLADLDVKGKASPDESRSLRRPENLQTWRDVLVGMKVLNEQNLSWINAKHKEKVTDAKSTTGWARIDLDKIDAKHRKRKATMTRFRLAVEARLREVRSRLRGDIVE